MRIGILGTIWLNTPPRDYGGTEQIIYNLVNGLSKRGHDVTLFGPQTAQIKARLFPTVKFPLRDLKIPWTDILYHLYHITQAYDHSNQFDILHVHLNRAQDYIAFPLTLFSSTPVLFTFHGALSKSKGQKDNYHILMKYKEFPFTSISYSQRSGIKLNFIDTIYNSINLADYPFSSHHNGYLVWLGKVSPWKGTKEAIEIAQRVKKPIYVLGKVDRDEPIISSYYQKYVKPLFSLPGVFWKENVELKEKSQLLGKADALLNPVQWEEPFGLIMIEAQATGTPVIAFNRGAAPEVIKDTQTGFVVDTPDEMVAKLAKLDTIKRINCRKFIADNFSIDRMVSGYESAYAQTITQWPSILNKQKQHLKQW